MLVGCKGVARRSRPSSARRCQKKKSREFYQSGLAKTDFIEGATLALLFENKRLTTSTNRPSSSTWRRGRQTRGTQLKRPIGPEVALELREVGGVHDAVQVGIQGDVVGRRSGRDIRFRAKRVLEQVEVGGIHDDVRTAVANRRR